MFIPWVTARSLRWARGTLGSLICIVIALTPAVLLTSCGAPSGGGTGGGDGGGDPVNEPDDPVAREIEEADIVQYQDGYFYLANRWTGLRIIDATDIERPMIAGRAAMQGRAVELFVRDELAIVLASADFFYCAGVPVGFDDAELGESLLEPDYNGSRITVVDVSDKLEPVVVAEFDLDGFVTDTRRVGDVIYAAGNLPSGYVLPDDLDTNGDGEEFGGDPFSGRPRAFVASINIADPVGPRLVDRAIFFGDSFEIHVAHQDAMFVAGDDPSVSDTTLVTFVDISDAEGDIVLRDQFRVPGTIRNRFFMDEFGGTFRIVTEELPSSFSAPRLASLYTYDANDPDNVVRLARLPILDNQSVAAVRFDGRRAYAASASANDPLFVMDLADPAFPRITGDLEAPGFSTHLVPLGRRLLALGYDNGDLARPSLSLYDVADPAAPKPMSRIVLGESGDIIDTEAAYDEKALKVIEEFELVLLPFSFFDDTLLEYVDGVQLIDLFPTRLQERGRVDHRGLVRRAGVVDERLWTLSDETFRVSDIDDRDSPLGLRTVGIISEQELLDAGLSDCVDSVRQRERADDFPPFGGDGQGGGGGCGAGAGASAALALTLSLVGVRIRRGRDS